MPQLGFSNVSLPWSRHALSNLTIHLKTNILLQVFQDKRQCALERSGHKVFCPSMVNLEHTMEAIPAPNGDTSGKSSVPFSYGGCPRTDTHP